MLHLEIGLNIPISSEQLVKTDSKKFILTISSISFKNILFARYEDVYIQLFQQFGWKRVAALTEDGQKYTEYISHMENSLKQHDVELISNKKFPRNLIPQEMSRVRKIPNFSLKNHLTIYLIFHRT